MIWRRKGDRVVNQGDSTGQSHDSMSGTGGAATVDGITQPPAQPRMNLEVKNTDYLLEGRSAAYQGASQGALAQRSYSVPRAYKISGSICCVRPVVVHGELDGQELVAGLVSVAPGGALRGGLRVGTLLVGGLVDGRVEASEVIDVSSQGEIRGEIHTPSMRAQAGARITGASLKVGQSR